MAALGPVLSDCLSLLLPLDGLELLLGLEWDTRARIQVVPWRVGTFRTFRNIEKKGLVELYNAHKFGNGQLMLRKILGLPLSS